MQEFLRAELERLAARPSVRRCLDTSLHGTWAEEINRITFALRPVAGWTGS